MALMATVTDMATQPKGKIRVPRRCWVALATLPAAAFGQVADLPGVAIETSTMSAGTSTASAGRRAWKIEPRVSVTETFTDNVTLSATNRTSDRITEFAPGIRVVADSARLTGHADYELRESVYANDSARNRTQNFLNAFGKLEAVEQHVFVDFSGRVSQQAISAFATQSPTNASVNPNLVETTAYRVSPYVRGKVASYADYEVRYSLESSRSDARAGSDTVNGVWAARLGGSTPLAALAWSVDATSQEVQYGDRRRTVADTFDAKLSYQFAQQYRVWLKSGREANDYFSLTKTSYPTEGIGFEWTPGARTRLSLGHEKHFFGNSNNLDFSHRTPKTVWKFSQGRTVSVLPNQLTTVGLGTVFDLLNSQFSSQIPDAIERASAVSAFLLASGIPADTVVTSGFLSARVSVQKRSELSFAILGVRNVVTVAATRSENQALSPGVLGDDFDNSPGIRQNGVSLGWTYKLSPFSSLKAAASRQSSAGSGGTVGATNLRTLHMAFQTRLGTATNLSLALRRSEFESATAPYAEQAATGTLSLRF